MVSKLAFLFPCFTLIYLIDTLFKRRFRVYFRMTLATFAFVMLIFDLFVSLVFYVNCVDVTYRYGYGNCLGWIYPTLDFQVMIGVSIIMLVIALYGTFRDWSRKSYYTLGSVVIYFGAAARLFVLAGASQAFAIAGSSSNPIVFEIFSVVVIYGMASTAIYFTIFCLGLFRPRTLRRLPE
jgi:hypothetical protein